MSKDARVGKFRNALFSRQPFTTKTTRDRSAKRSGRSLRFEPLDPRLMLSANQAPLVDAGLDLNVGFSDTAHLAGIVSDDGLPESGSITTAWVKVRGPGNVLFDDPSALATDAAFDALGTYVLRLEANDGQLTAADSITVTVDDVGQVIVEAGPDQSISFSSALDLDGTITVDGFQDSVDVLTTWIAVSGPNLVTFDDVSAVDTMATFADPGTYVLRLEAIDGSQTAGDDVTIDVYAVNEAPVVEAGVDQSILLTEVATLSGSVTDDGVPVAPGRLTLIWSRGSGPGTVMFGNATSPTTTAQFSVAGDYILQLTATDGQLTSTDTVAFTVQAANQSPLVDAGLDGSVLVSAAFALDGTVTDDGFPGLSGTLTTTWRKVSGPGTISFGDASSIDTTATFSEPGTYLLKLTADDGEFATDDEVSITVETSGQVAVPLDANLGTLTAPMEKKDHPDATDGQYVASNVANQGTISFTVNIEQAGEYVIWARVLGPTSSEDSFFVSVDGGPEDVFDVAEGTWSSAWQWTVVNGRGEVGQPLTLNPHAFTLSEGTHTIKFRAREAKTGLDQILITNDLAFAPNQAPVVDAGEDQSALVSAMLSLDGTVTDDGQPDAPGDTTTAWSVISGPGEVTFADPAAVDTTAQFSEAGTYMLKLAANDGQYTTYDFVIVTITTGVPQTVEGFFVSPNGTAHGDGSLDNPWNLAAALSHPNSVKPGDTIWLRGGTYRGGFTSTLIGTADKPIIVRAYPNEIVAIDLFNPSAGPGNLHINGEHTEFRDFEILSTDPVTREFDDPAWHKRGFININGSYIKLVNNIIHDIYNVGFWSSGAGGELYGNLIYNVGDYASGEGHGLYTQNKLGTKFIRNNLFFNQFEYNISAYGQNGPLTGFHFEGNAFINSAGARGVGFSRRGNMLMGGGLPAEAIKITENVSYSVPDVNKKPGVIDLGWSNTLNKDLELTDNYFAGELRFLKPWEQITASGNTVVGYVTNPSYGPESGITAIVNDTGTQVFVRANEYESGRANISIFNWDEDPTVGVDLSSVLTVGDSYAVHHVYDLGTPITSGVYNGGEITVPMAATAAPIPIGGLPSGYTPITTGPEFGAFIVTSLGSPQPLLAIDGPATVQASEVLSSEALRPVVDYAISQWAAMGISKAQTTALRNVQFEIADLTGARLGQATINTITVDTNGANHGWFVDPTPGLDEEFLRQGRAIVADISGPAADRMDLLSVVMHELGHVLGYGHEDSEVDPNHLMNDSLGTRFRKGIGIDAVDAVFTD